MKPASVLDADMRTVAGWLVDGWRWWTGELAAMVPASWRRRVRGQCRELAYDPATATFHGPIGRGRCAIVLPLGLCLLRHLDRPQMAERDAMTMVALDRDRIMPGDTLVAARVHAREVATGRMTLVVAGLPRSDAVRLGDALKISGLAPAAVFAPDPAGESIDLLPTLRAAGLAGSPADAAARWWAIAGFLFLFNVGLLVWRDVAATEAMREAVEQQQPAVTAARRLVGRIQQDDAIAGATLAARRHGEPLAQMNRLAVALPHGVWLQRLAVQGDTLRIVGFRPARVDVAGALRQAGFAVVRYGDSASGGNQLGQPFELTLRRHAPARGR